MTRYDRKNGSSIRPCDPCDGMGMRVGSSETGNALFALFGAVVLVGLVTAGVNNFIRGPMQTSIKQSKNSMAKNSMAVAAQVAVMGSATGVAASDYYRIFITSTNYTGNLGGLAGADASCQARADAAGLGGMYKAWLSDGTANVSTRLVRSNSPYKLLNGATVASNWDDLVDGTLSTAITINENGGSNSDSVWTGTESNGTAGTNNCTNWSTASNAVSGRKGTPTNTTAGWTASGNNTCDQMKRLYCIDQQTPTTGMGDCDNDGTVEPLEYKDKGTNAAPVGGGLVPDAVGVNKIDPWGTPYGYCVWDYGSVALSTSCRGTSGVDKRLAGHVTAQDTPVVAIVSAGPDRTFTTTCRSYAAADANSNGVLTDAGDLPLVGKAAANDDDLIFTYTYSEAAAATGGLWSLKSSNAGMATIAKKIESQAAKFTGSALFGKITAGVGDFVDVLSGLRLSPPGIAATCNASNKYSMRRNASSNSVEICDGAAWMPMGKTQGVTPLTEVKVFMSDPYQGGLGGLVGADAKCQAEADTAGLPGTYKAWLADDTYSPDNRFIKYNVPYKRIDGVLVANNWDDLTDGTLTNPISTDEYGAGAPSFQITITNTNPDGTVYSTTATCNNFKSSASIPIQAGTRNGTNSTWVNLLTISCINAARTYCFQQSADKPVTANIPTQATVFVTSATYTGNLGGLSGADDKCQTRALAAGLTGQYRAWLSDSLVSPANRFNKPTNGYKLVDGTTVASSWADLTDATLSAAINKDETGATPATTSAVWSNTQTSGVVRTVAANCTNWTSESGSGSAGTRTATDANWSIGSNPTCSSAARLYCFQQTTAGTDGGRFGTLSDAKTDYAAGNFFAGPLAGGAITSGTYNTGFGRGALGQVTTGYENTGFGYQAGNAITTGYRNTTLGNQALKTVTTGYGNTAGGYAAGGSVASGENYTTSLGNISGTYIGTMSVSMGSNTGNGGAYSTFVGFQAGQNNTADYTTAVGYSALQANTTGERNTAIGSSALSRNIAGNDNTAVGFNALASSTVSENTAVGYGTLQELATNLRNVAIGSAASRYITGDDNTSIGYNALRGQLGSSTGSENTAIGTLTLYQVTTGSDNTAVGSRALTNNQNGNDNTAIGYYAQSASISNSNNVAVGSYALTAAKADNNVALGTNALKALISGTMNVAAGYNAGALLTSSSNNVLIGSDALSGVNNANDGTVAVGYQAMKNSTGGFNTALGYQALMATTGAYNTVAGYQAYRNANNASYTTAAGAYAGYLNVGANIGNTAIGYNAGRFNTNNYNTLVGYAAGVVLNTASNFNTAIGYGALDGASNASAPSVGNTALGQDSIGASGSFSGNTAAGYRTLASNTGNFNTALGAKALESNLNGGFNTAIGYSAMRANISGLGNTAVGSNALSSMNGTGFVAADCTGLGTVQATDTTTGHCYYKGPSSLTFSEARNDCRANGAYLATSTSSAEQNIIKGVNGGSISWIGGQDIDNDGVYIWDSGPEKGVPFYDATTNTSLYGQYNNIATTLPAGNCVYLNPTSGTWGFPISCNNSVFNICEKDPPSQRATYNTAAGTRALASLTTGSYNTAIGFETLKSATTGDMNTAFGYQAGANIITGSTNTAIGAYSGPNSGALNNTVALGYQASVTASNAVRVGNGSITTIEGQVAFTATSDTRVKENIAPTDLGLDFIMKLKPVSYRLKRGNGRVDYGFLAQDVDAALDGRVTNMIIRRNDEMRTMELRASDLIAPLVKAMQEQDVIIKRLEQKIAAIKNARASRSCSRDVPTGREGAR